MPDYDRMPEHERLTVISIAAKMMGMHAQSLRHYKRLGPVRRAELQSYRDRLLPATVEEEDSYDS